MGILRAASAFLPIVFLAGMAPLPAATPGPEIWIALRADGRIGKGRVDDPFDGGGNRLSPLLQTWLTRDGALVHLAPGDYDLFAPVGPMGNNAILQGAGRDVAVLHNQKIPAAGEGFHLFTTNYSSHWAEIRDLTLDGGFKRLNSPDSSDISAIFLTGGGVVQNVHLKHFGGGTKFPVECFHCLINPSVSSSGTGSRNNLVDRVLFDQIDGIGDGIDMQGSNVAALPSPAYLYAQGTVSNCTVDLGTTGSQGITVSGFVNVVDNFVTGGGPTAALFFVDSWINDGGLVSGNRGVSTGAQYGMVINAQTSGSRWRAGHVVNNTIILSRAQDGGGYQFQGPYFSCNVISGNVFLNLAKPERNVWAMMGRNIGPGNLFSGNILDANVSSGAELWMDEAAQNSLIKDNIHPDGSPVSPHPLPVLTGPSCAMPDWWQWARKKLKTGIYLVNMDRSP